MDHLFICLLTMWISSFAGFSIFLLVCLLKINHRNSLHILNLNHLLNMCIANTLWPASLNEEKFLILIKPNISIFSFMVSCFICLFYGLLFYCL